jgi:sulfite oxidase
MSTISKAPDFQVRQDRPFNGGPQLASLARSFVTPLEQFFVRSHGDVPTIDRDRHRVRVSGDVRRPLELSLADLAARFARREVTATLQCAGNRRAEMTAHRPTPGELGWGSEAIGNAVWAGVALADVLAAAEPLPSAAHVELVGADEAERHGDRFPFACSIPLDKAVGREVLVAVEMNGLPLEPLHGAPLRAVVPGCIGARSVKWLREIRLRSAPSENYFQARAYRLFAPEITAENVVWENGVMLNETSVTSIITAPAAGAVLPAGDVRIEGVALAGGGRRIERVEISTDGGSRWHVVRLDPAADRWSWRLWSCDRALPAGEHEVIARAWDSAGQTQPARVDEIWNFKGYMNNARHRVAFRCR